MSIAPSRIASLDGLRGIAILGILLMNIAAFALPDAAYSNPLAQPDPRLADLWTWAVLFVVADGKMRGLLALLFGAGVAILAARAEAAGEDGQAVHLRRMRWLFVIGLAHFYLVWEGDILSLYAAAGVVAWLFVGAPVPTLIGWAAALLVLGGVMMATLVGGLGLPDALTAAAIADEYGVPDSDALATEIALMRSGYGAITLERLREVGLQPFWQILLSGPETLALMLLGMAGVRTGFLTGGWARSRYLRVAGLGYVISLPLSIWLAASIWRAGFTGDAVAAFSIGAALPVRLPMILAHAALALWWLGGPAGRLHALLAATGRLALTNYLLCSLAMTILFYGYGFGLFGTLSRFALLGIVAIAWATMLIGSTLWARHFHLGPMEWLWRSLSARRCLPIKAIANKSQYR